VQGAGLPMGDQGGICVFLARAMWQMHTQGSEQSHSSEASRGSKGASKEGSRKAARCTGKNIYVPLFSVFNLKFLIYLL